MEPYETAKDCAACGYGGWEKPELVMDVSKDASIREAYVVPPWSKTEYHIAQKTVPLHDAPTVPAHLCRTCKRCGYTWDETPLNQTEVT
jgi:hypothetical protein